MLLRFTRPLQALLVAECGAYRAGYGQCEKDRFQAGANNSKEFVAPFVLLCDTKSRMGDTDEEQGWIRASQAGDQMAFEQLVIRHQRMIYALTSRLTSGTAEAEDLAQETFIAAWVQIHNFRGSAQFSSWLYRIAINCCLNMRKRAARRTEVHQELARQEVGASASGGDTLALAVQAALLQLPPKQRAAIVLTTYEGLSHAEAARALNCTEPTVSWRIFAARRKLKRALQSMARHSHD